MVSSAPPPTFSHARIPMDEKDHVFARFKDDKPASAERHERLSIPGRGAGSSNRSVEVVHARLGAMSPAKGGARRLGPRAHPVPAEGSLPSQQVTFLPAVAEPDLAEAPTLVTHVMPAWEPSGLPDEAAISRRVEASGPEALYVIAESSPRGRKTVPRFADPFDAADDGANCLRCGYAIQPARVRRGLMTCAGCG